MKKINTKEMMTLYERLQNNCKLMRYTSDVQLKAYTSANVAIRHEMQDVCDPLTKNIDAVQKLAKVRKIDAEVVLARLYEINEYLGISKKAMKGTKVIVNENAQRFSSAYKGSPESTYFEAEYNGSAWIVTNIYRAECGKNKFNVELSEEAKNAFLNKAVTLGY